MADDYAPVLDYIAAYWPRITCYNPKSRGTLIGLPRPYLVPHAGTQELFYWDSYFMALGVAGTRHEARIVDLAENLAAMLRRFGLIPNASRYYYLSRSQPPLFVELIWLAYRVKQDSDPTGAPAFLRRMMALA